MTCSSKESEGGINKTSKRKKREWIKNRHTRRMDDREESPVEVRRNTKWLPNKEYYPAGDTWETVYLLVSSEKMEESDAWLHCMFMYCDRREYTNSPKTLSVCIMFFFFIERVCSDTDLSIMMPENVVWRSWSIIDQTRQLQRRSTVQVDYRSF